MRQLSYYNALYNTMIIKEPDTIKTIVSGIDTDFYKSYCNEHQPKVDWKFITIIHQLECNGDKARQILNGEKWNTRTKYVPKGLGPFKNWHDSANKALKIQNILVTEWTIATTLFELERWNGWGYVNKGINSPYIWSKTNHYTRGKYTSDGKWSKTAVSSQIGAAALLYFLNKVV